MYNVFMIKNLRIFIVVLLIAVIVFLVFLKKDSQYAFDKEIIVKNTVLDVAIVSTDEERSRGLSNHRPLKDNEALLFVFERPDFYGIWMKEMRFPIDVIWFDDEMKIVSVRENFSPDSFPEAAYPSHEAFWVLETKAGFVKDHRILMGDELKIFD